MKRSIITLLFACCLSLSAIKADDLKNYPTAASRLADTFDLGITLGSTGVGVEVSAMPTSFMRVRTGVDFMPRFNVPLNFNVDNYRDGAVAGTDFSKLQEMMKEISGFDVDKTVKMDCKAKMVNFKLLVDFFPLRNKHWYLTAGFYWGSSKIGSAVNAMEEMPSLVAIGMYNKMYDYVMNTDFIEEPIYNDFYLDPEVADALKDRMEEYGMIGIHVGDRPDGTPYMMKPGSDATVKADLIVNSFKPYLGAGYVTTFGRHINFGVDGGVLFWGGTPKVVTHEGVDLAKDVDNIAGKVGSYVKVAKAMKVYPVLNLRIAYRFRL